MRPALVRRTALAASAVCLALLATACGGSDPDGGSDKGGDGTKAGKADEKAAAQPAVKAKTAAELDELALAEGDVKDHEIQKVGAGEAPDSGDIKVDKAGCEPLAHAMTGVRVGEPAATAQRGVSQKAKKPAEPSLDELAEMTEEEIAEAFIGALDMTMTTVSLSSYDGAGAEQALADLRTAATDCGGGFTSTAPRDKRKVTGITEEKVTGGEESAAWTLTTDMEGDVVSVKLAVVRQGGTLASFVSLNLASASGKKDYPLPTAVIDAQLAKLG
ncbi:hypothetical protein CUT44_32285 [Streptomyces carminius]|uniref:Lipoprotein n=2 Tax=Streptomyces carminius TaxID=2665496 RepID=A0A2M8LPS1_9ACTN|nr:hypothetical protein [Streptomyces carminius]PJE93949.1 hypothetical protein CUT44_32285 [Streptomyces carminius]